MSLQILFLLVLPYNLFSSVTCDSGNCPAQGEETSLLQYKEVQKQPFGEVPAGAIPTVSISNPIPDGSQMGRILTGTALRPEKECPEGMIPVGQCPPPPQNYMSWPPDGSGVGPMIFNKSVAGLPGPKSFVGCKTCPSCPSKLGALYTTISAFSEIQPTPACQAPVDNAVGGTSSAFGSLQDPALVWSILGYGATNHGCFGHTFVNLTELNNPCYSFGARIQAGVPYFRPVPEDILIDSCGKKGAIRLFCPDCKPRSLCPNCDPPLAEDYPQRYTWILQFDDRPDSEYGFVITKLNAVLDTELTMDTSIQDYDYDPFVCQVLRPLSFYPPISPRTYRLELPVEKFSNCTECPDCPERMETMSKAFAAFAEGDYTPFKSLLDPNNFTFIVAGAGPSKGGCMTAIYDNTKEWFTPKAFWGRILAMSQGDPTLMASDITTASCGDRSNIYWAWSIKGKSNFVYTLTGSWTLYYSDGSKHGASLLGGEIFPPKPPSGAGFTITKILQNFDTEVTMNMAVRERASDTVDCDLTEPGGWADVVSHTSLQP